VRKLDSRALLRVADRGGTWIGYPPESFFSELLL